MATATKRRSVNNVDPGMLAYLEGTENPQTTERVSLKSQAKPDYDPNMGWFDLDLIYEMGEGEYKLGIEGEVDISNPRTEFDPVEMARLKASMKEKGQKQAVKLRAVMRNGIVVFELTDGARRVRNIRELRKEELAINPNSTKWAKVKGELENVNAFDAFEDALISDVQKESLNAIDRANAIVKQRQLMQQRVDLAYARIKPKDPNGKPTDGEWINAFKAWASEPQWVLDILERARDNQLAGRRGQLPTVLWSDVELRVGMTENRLLDYAQIAKVDDRARDIIRENGIPFRTALAIAKEKTPQKQRKLAREAVRQGLTSKEVEAKVKPKATTPAVVNEVLAKLNPALSEIATAHKRLETAQLSPEERVEASRLIGLILGHAQEMAARVGGAG